MRKLIPLILMLSMLTLVGCAEDNDTNDNNDTNNTDTNENGDDMNNDNVGNDTANLNDDNMTALDNNNLNDNNATMMAQGNKDYVTSLRDLDNTLRSDLNDLDGRETGDLDYTQRGELYRSRAQAYQTALDGIDGLDYGDEYADYNNSVRQYYETGYNTYNDLATNYDGFANEDDERAFLDEIGEDGARIARNVEDGYNNALRDLGINKNTTTTRNE